MLGYSLHSVILLCQLHILPQCIGPIHSWFHLNSLGSIQPGCSLAHRTDQLTMPTQPSLPSMYHFLHFFGMKGQWKWTCPRPHHYDRFSQDLNTWSSDHWYWALTNSATMAIFQYLESLYLHICLNLTSNDIEKGHEKWLQLFLKSTYNKRSADVWNQFSWSISHSG